MLRLVKIVTEILSDFFFKCFPAATQLARCGQVHQERRRVVCLISEKQENPKDTRFRVECTFERTALLLKKKSTSASMVAPFLCFVLLLCRHTTSPPSTPGMVKGDVQ